MSTGSVTRRQAIGTGMGFVAGFAAAPLVRAGGVGRASAKSGRGPVVMGSGGHTYEVQHDWAVLPSTHAFGNTHGVCVDSKGMVYIKHTVHSSSSSGDAVCVFDPAGKFVRSWGAEFRGGAHGLTLSKEEGGEFLWLSDCNRAVVRKTTLTGETVLDLKWPEDSGQYGGVGEYKPTNVAVVPRDAVDGAGKPHAMRGYVFVADGYGKSWIHVFDPRGNYVRSFGGPGNQRGQTSCPHGIAIDSRGGGEPRLVVADRSNRRLQYFTLDGRHAGFVTDELRSPCHFDTHGELLLVPDLEARVTLLDKDNKLVVQLGDGENFGLRDKPREQFVAGRFIAPHSACFDNEGNIFVVEWVEVGRVTKLRRVGA